MSMLEMKIELQVQIQRGESTRLIATLFKSVVVKSSFNPYSHEVRTIVRGITCYSDL